jgi:twitching motility protein PilU
MQTFDMALFDLYEAGKIGMEEALKNADSLNELRLNIKLNSLHHRKEEHSSGLDHLSLEAHAEPEVVEDAEENK